jgi:hypothetical protein
LYSWLRVSATNDEQNTGSKIPTCGDIYRPSGEFQITLAETGHDTRL